MQNQMCYVCNKFVDLEKHDCEVAKKLVENPLELKCAHIHSDAIPTITKGIMI